MTSSVRLLNIAERLQAELDDYIELHKDLLDAYQHLLDENERLKDTIAIMAEDSYKNRDTN